jgi:hypothetical protein
MPRKSRKSKLVRVKKGYRLKKGYQVVPAKLKSTPTGIDIFGISGLGKF